MAESSCSLAAAILRLEAPAVEQRQRNQRARAISARVPIHQVAHAEGADARERSQAHVRIERSLRGEALGIGGLHQRAGGQHVRTAREEIDGQILGHRQCFLHLQHRALDRGVRRSALAGQRCELVHRDLRGRLRLCARHPSLGQLPFRFADLELRIEPRAHAAACDVDDILPLQLGTMGDVGERVFPIELDVGLGDRPGEHQTRVVLVEARGFGKIPGAVYGIGLAPPEIQIPPQARAGLGHARSCFPRAAAG